MSQEQQGDIKSKWLKHTDEPYPFPEKPQEGTQETPGEQNGKKLDAKADNSEALDRVEFFEKARQAKAIFAKNGKMGLYFDTLKNFNCETMNDIPGEKEEEFIKALQAAIDQMNEG